MRDLEEKLESELDNFKSQIPNGDGTVSGLKERMTFVLNNLDDFKKIIDKISADYISKNSLSELEMKALKDISKEYYLRFARSLS